MESNQIPDNLVEYVMKLEDALMTLSRMYTNTAIRQIVSDALANRELLINLVDVEIPAEYLGETSDAK